MYLNELDIIESEILSSLDNSATILDKAEMEV